MRDRMYVTRMRHKRADEYLAAEKLPKMSMRAEGVRAGDIFPGLGRVTVEPRWTGRHLVFRLFNPNKVAPSSRTRGGDDSIMYIIRRPEEIVMIVRADG